MITLTQRSVSPAVPDFILAASVMLIAFAISPRTATGGEIIPSIGFSQSGSGASTQPFFGLAIRQNLMPMLKGELGVAYRSHDYLGGLIHERQVPVSASLWLSPTPMMYVGGGLGWYNSSASAPFGIPISVGDSKLATHVGAGMELPLVPGIASLDLNARYIFMGQQTGVLSSLDALGGNFWTAQAGVALHF